MVRPGRATELDARTATSGRLAAMGLQPQPQPAGWVPAGVVAPDAAPTNPVATKAVTAPPDVAELAARLMPAGEPPTAPAQPAPAPPAIGELARAWVQDRLPPWTHGLVDRVRIGSLLAGVACLASLILLAVLLLHHHSAAGYASPYDATSPGSSSSADLVASAPSDLASGSASIVVDVGGRVRKPGLVTLPMGARVADAIAAAGGPLHEKEIATLDLAARVSDGQLLLIGVTSGASGGGPTSTGDGTGADGGAAAPVSLSSGTIDDLETLPGVGPVTAQKIIDWRTAHNGFTSVEQLQQVPGIGPTRYAALSPLVTP